MNFEKDVSLKQITTIKTGGLAKLFCEIHSIEELQEAVRYCHQNQIRFTVLGKGSNILFDDRGFNGLVLLNKIGFFYQEESIIHVGSGYSFALLGTQTARQGWKGLEFAAGIPGTVGGAIYMNAGAGGQDTFQALFSVTYIDSIGEIIDISKEKLEWGYRSSCFQHQNGAIAAGRFQLQRCEKSRDRQLKMVDYRIKTQPYTDYSAGCVFKNPGGTISAGALIEQCDLKGFQMGGAEISKIHANFIVNKNQATTQDILNLTNYIQQIVLEKTGYSLEAEIQVIPYDDHDMG